MNAIFLATQFYMFAVCYDFGLQNITCSTSLRNHRRIVILWCKKSRSDGTSHLSVGDTIIRMMGMGKENDVERSSSLTFFIIN